MKKGVKKLYSSKRPSHPDDAHTKSKKFFKKKGRKRVRKMLKKMTDENGV